MRALEPRKPSVRASQLRNRNQSRPNRIDIDAPTFDLTESNWITNATLRSLENKWQTAVKEHDAETLDKLLAYSFQATSINGRTASKARTLKNVREDKNVYRSARAKDMTITMKRADIAIVTGISVQSGTKENGEKIFQHNSVQRHLEAAQRRMDLRRQRSEQSSGRALARRNSLPSAR